MNFGSLSTKYKHILELMTYQLQKPFASVIILKSWNIKIIYCICINDKKKNLKIIKCPEGCGMYETDSRISCVCFVLSLHMFWQKLRRMEQWFIGKTEQQVEWSRKHDSTCNGRNKRHPFRDLILCPQIHDQPRQITHERPVVYIAIFIYILKNN